MDITNRSPRRFGGFLMTDQRSADEAVMLMRLAPDQDEPFSLEFYGCLIVAALHIFRRPTGLTFDISHTPVVTDAAGKTVSQLTADRMPDTMRSALGRIRQRLRTRSAEHGGAAIPPAIVDQLQFFVFEKGDAPVTLEWRISYAGRTYPLHRPARDR